MTYLEQFTDDQRALLTALPYRTGLWIGESDATGGDEARDAEMAALETLVTGYVEDFCKSEFVEELMRAMLTNREHWGEWRKNIDRVPQEAREAIDIVASRLDYRTVSAFKHNLIEIAMTVAMAYRELDEKTPWLEKIRVYVRYYKNRWRKKNEGLSLEESLRISNAEYKALSAITTALQPDIREGLPPAPLY